MSYVDYGLGVFPFSLHNCSHVIQSSGDHLPTSASLPGTKNSSSIVSNSCYQLIINNLIYLGTCTEHELALAQSELKKYRQLRLTEEQLSILKRLENDCKRYEEIKGLQADTEVETETFGHDKRQPVFNESENSEQCYVSLSSPRDEQNNNGCSCDSANPSSCKWSKNENLISKEIFRAIIIEKDSEIISLKTEKAVKETEVKELEEEKRTLKIIMEKLENDIESLESRARISRSSVEEVVRKKNEELEDLRQNRDTMKENLCSEREARISVEKKLSSIVAEIQALRKSFKEEAKIAERRIQMLEESNSSQSSLVKQLQRDRENLDKQNIEQENEIEKLLNIMKRLNEKHNRSKAELLLSEDRVVQCRDQLEKVEREVNRLIAELTDCLGRVEPSVAEPAEKELYARASQLIRGLSKFVNEHGTCQADRQNLLRQIHRLQARRPEEAARPVCNENFIAIKSDLQDIVDDLIFRLDEARRTEKTKRIYAQLAGEASLALQKLEQKIDDHNVYKHCENFLLLELENLQDALDGAERTINGLECQKYARNTELSSSRCPSTELEAVLSKKILQRVQNSTQIAIRITTALRDDSRSKETYNRNVESQLQQTLLALNEIGVEKCQLQSDYAKCEEKRVEFSAQVEKLKVSLAEKSEELECCRERANVAEKKFQDSRTENAALIRKSDEMIESLQRELQNREAKLRDYGKFNDFLNSKLEESNRMIEQLQSNVVRENMRKLDLDSFTALHERILELVAEKDELTDKILLLQSQLGSYERNNDKLQTHLTQLFQDNESLERAIRNFKSENEKLASRVIRESHAENASIRAKCDEVLEKMGKISRDSSARQICRKRSDTEFKAHKDKLCYQEKELMMKEREIVDLRRKLESLNAEMIEVRSKDDSGSLLKRIEVLAKEKCELQEELKQTLAKYEDKLAEMHKQYKQSEIELHKMHNDSIRCLEAKYTEMMREEGGIFNAESWLQSLSPSELQELHDRICKTPLCADSTYEKELFEEQSKRSLTAKSTASNYGIKKSLQARKDARNLRMSNSNFAKPNVNRRISSSSNQSLIIPEKDHNPHKPPRFK